MNFFTSFVASFCASAVFLGALWLICPDGNMSKSVKFALSLVFLVTVAAAGITVKQSSVSFDFEKPPEIDTKSLEENSLEYAFRRLLDEAGINYRKITVFTDKTEDGSIIISKVKVVSDCDSLRIAEALGISEVEVESE